MTDPTTPTPDQLAQALGVTHGHEAAHPGCHRRWITYGDPTCGRGGQRDHEHTDTCRVPYVHECWGSVVHGPGHTCRCGAELSSAATSTSTGAPALDALVGRFNALSDAAGNPGAPRPTPGACICGPRGDGTGPYDGDPDPRCPEHGHVYDDPPQRTTDDRIDHVASGIANLSMRLRDEHEGTHLVLATIGQRLHRIEGKLDLLAHGLETHYVTDHPDLAPAVERTLSAMDRVTQTDAVPVIAGVIDAHDISSRLLDDEAAELAERIAQALYGPIPGEGAPTEGDDRRPLDLRGHPCTRPVGPAGPPYGEPPACGQPATEVDSIGRPRCPEHLAQAQNATSVDDEGDG